MPGLRGMAVRNFAFHPQVRELRGQNVADPRSQLRNAPHLPRRREIQFELPYFFSHCTSHMTRVNTTLSRIHVTTGK
jgi:hypothetical protein